MDESRDMTFSELKEKDVVTVEGNNVGKPVDLVFSLQSQKVRGIVTPYGKRCLFFHSQELYIPYSRIKKIGDDVIIVDVAPCKRKEVSDKDHSYDKRCDGQCDKCMLFDCPSRWKNDYDSYN